jgi:hypothetical protein
VIRKKEMETDEKRNLFLFSTALFAHHHHSHITQLTCDLSISCPCSDSIQQKKPSSKLSSFAQKKILKKKEFIIKKQTPLLRARLNRNKRIEAPRPGNQN